MLSLSVYIVLLLGIAFCSSYIHATFDHYHCHFLVHRLNVTVTEIITNYFIAGRWYFYLKNTYFILVCGMRTKNSSSLWYIEHVCILYIWKTHWNSYQYIELFLCKYKRCSHIISLCIHIFWFDYGSNGPFQLTEVAFNECQILCMHQFEIRWNQIQSFIIQIEQDRHIESPELQWKFRRPAPSIYWAFNVSSYESG